MAKLFRFLLLLLPTLLLTVVSCKKEDGPATPPPTPTTGLTATLDKATVTPGDYVTISTSADLDAAKTTWEITVGGRKVTAGKVDARQVVFAVPALPAGPLPLDLSALGVKAPPVLTMGPYTAITNPDAVLAAFNTGAKGAVTHLEQLAQSPTTPVPAQSIAFIKNLEQALTTLQTGLSAAEKLELAYTLQKMTFEKVDFTALQQRRGSITETDPGVPFIRMGKKYVAHKVVLVVSVLAFVKLASIPSPDLVTKGGAIAAALLGAYNLVQCTNIIDLLANQLGIVLSTDLTGNGSNLLAGPQAPTALTFPGSSVRSFGIDATGRTMTRGDGGMSALMQSIFSAQQSIQEAYQSFLTNYNRVRAVFGLGESSLPAYSDPVKPAAASGKVALSPTLVLVRNVSNSAISLSTAVVSDKLKLTATSSLKVKTPFTFDLVYQNAELGVNTKNTVSAEFEPNVDSLEFFRKAVLGKWNTTMYWIAWGTTSGEVAYGTGVCQLNPGGVGVGISDQQPTVGGNGAITASNGPLVWEVTGGPGSGYYLSYGPAEFFRTWAYRGRIRHLKYNYRTDRPLSNNSSVLYSISAKQ